MPVFEIAYTHTSMSDGIFAIVAIISVLASAVGLWSAIRRRQLMRRLLRSLDSAQLKQLGIEDPSPKP